MASFAQAGSTYDQAMNRAKRAAVAAISDPDALLDFHDNLDTNNNLLHLMSGEISSLHITVQELRNEIEAIKAQMNIPASMGGYQPTPPRQGNLFADWYGARLDEEGTGV